MQRKQRLFHGAGMRGVQCLAFSPNGKSLVSVCTDDGHTMFVWSWGAAQCVLQVSRILSTYQLKGALKRCLKRTQTAGCNRRCKQDVIVMRIAFYKLYRRVAQHAK